MSKNCVACNAFFDDKKYATCFSCRNGKAPEGKQKCTKCHKTMDESYPKTTCMSCLMKKRQAYAASHPNVQSKCDFMNEFGVKCQLNKKGVKYCETHEKVAQLNGFSPKVDTTKIMKNETSVKIIEDATPVSVKKEEISDTDVKKYVVMSEKSRKITDEQIKEILEYKDSGMNIASICQLMGLHKNMVSDVFHGHTKILSEMSKGDIINAIKMNGDKKVELVEKKTQLDTDEFKQAVFEDHGKKMRKLPASDMIKIMMMKKETVIAARSKMARYIFPNEIMKKLGNPNINLDVIKNLWSGKTKLYPSDFKNAEITYEDYIELLDMSRSNQPVSSD